MWSFSFSNQAKKVAGTACLSILLPTTLVSVYIYIRNFLIPKSISGKSHKLASFSLFKEAEVKGEGKKSQEWNHRENPKQIKCKPRVTSTLRAWIGYG